MFKPTIGAAGITHPSEAEAVASFKLLELGFVSHDAYYSQMFSDSEGTLFPAKSDFKCQYLPIYIESKSGYMNGLKTKANADKAKARFEKDLAEGFINLSNHNRKLLKASWSASVKKFKYVQEQLPSAGECVILVYDAVPDEETVNRLNTSKVFWCIYGDEHFRKFMSFRTLAKNGFRAQFPIKGHWFVSRGGLVS